MTDLALPRRLWWPWDQPVNRVGFWRGFTANADAVVTLHLAASGMCRVWLDGSEIAVPDSTMPLWFAVRHVAVPLTSGAHTLAIEATPGQHPCPFLLACLDWQEDGQIIRLATDGAWRMMAELPDGWQAHAE
jgi:hypothetical protein